MAQPRCRSHSRAETGRTRTRTACAVCQCCCAAWGRRSASALPAFRCVGAITGAAVATRVLKRTVQESVSVAKRAVALDVRDGRCWCACARARSPCDQPVTRLTARRAADVLGNAFLTRFFAGLHDPEDLASALKAYTRAVSCDARMRTHAQMPCRARCADSRCHRRKAAGREKRTRTCTTTAPT